MLGTGRPNCAMNFNVVTLMQEPSGAQRFYEVDELLPVDDNRTARPRRRQTAEDQPGHLGERRSRFRGAL